ncbi:MAG: signal peptidase I [Cyanobacteria bacterium P01_H01_bin.119]
MKKIGRSRRSLHLQGPDPWVAVNLSLIFPGLGQGYAGSLLKGIGFGVAAAGLLIYSGWSLFAAGGNTFRGLIAIAVLALVYGANLVDAYRSLINHPNQSKNTRWYGLFLSQILPGLGHFYHQQALVGGLLLGAGIFSAFGANFYPALVIVPPFIWAIACYHLYRTVPDRQPRRGAITAVIVGLLGVRLAIGHVPVWVDQALVQCIVPSESMVPTLQINDRIFVERNSSFRPQTGDIVVFRPTAEAIAITDIDPDTLVVKRVIGLPGQTVEITNGAILIDQMPLVEDYKAQSPSYTWGPAIIPLDSYFVLGDNRNVSADSHIWGAVPQDHLLGPAYKIYWPPHRIQPL